MAAYFEPRRDRLRTFRPIEGVGISTEASSVQIERTGGFHAHEHDLEAQRNGLAATFERVAALAPLIRQRIVMPIPHLKLALQRQEKIWVAVRHLLGDEEYLKLLANPIDHPALTQDEGASAQFFVRARNAREDRLQRYGDAAYYLARSIALADAAYASYLPPSGTEWAIYQQRLQRLGSTLRSGQRLDLRVTPALVNSELPYFKNLSSADLIAARGNEESFELWRAGIRSATRSINAMPSEQDFTEEAREALADSLDGPAAEVRRAISKSTSLKRNLRGASLLFGTGAAGSIVMGTPPALALGGAGATGMLDWLLQSLLPPSLDGRMAVLAHLQTDATPASSEGDWPRREGLLISPK